MELKLLENCGCFCDFLGTLKVSPISKKIFVRININTVQWTAAKIKLSNLKEWGERWVNIYQTLSKWNWY